MQPELPRGPIPERQRGSLRRVALSPAALGSARSSWQPKGSGPRSHAGSPVGTLSNSSMHTTPPSASTMAPPSMKKLLEEGSRITEAVKPAALLPFPEVYTYRCAGQGRGQHVSHCGTLEPAAPAGERTKRRTKNPQRCKIQSCWRKHQDLHPGKPLSTCQKQTCCVQGKAFA